MDSDCDAYPGPIVGECGERFDFTLQFEQLFLSIAPSLLLIVAAPWSLAYLMKQGAKVQKTSAKAVRLSRIKLTAWMAFAILQLVLVGLWAKYPGEWTVLHSSTVVASGLGVIDALALGALSYATHNRSVRPSSIISFYLLFSTAFDAVQCRTLWLLGDGFGHIALVFTLSLALKTVMLLVETRPKRTVLTPELQNCSPEATSGVINRALFWWLNDLMARGYKGELSMDSLYALDDELASDRLLNRLRVHWRVQKDKRKGKYPLLWALLYTIRVAVLECAFPRLCLSALKLSQPFLLVRVIQYMDNDNHESRNTGYGLIVATGLVYTGSAVAHTFYQHKQHRFMTMIRGALCSFVMHETTDLGSAADGSTVLTLIGVDVSRIADSLDAIHESWACAVEVTFAIWLLQKQLGLGSVGPLLVMAISYALMQVLSGHMPPAQKQWNGAIDKRVSTTSSIIGSMKEVKMLGVVGFWFDKIQGLMNHEIERASYFRTLIALMNIFANIPSSLGPMAAFGMAILATGLGAPELSVATVFMSLSIVGLVSNPLATLLFAIPNFVRSLACFERIQEFLDLAQEARTSRGKPLDGTRQMPFEDNPVNTADATIVINSASFKFKAEDEPVLRDITLRIPAGSFTVVVGKVGSGKTALLNSILGELVTTIGDLRIGHSIGGIAYCAQTSWLVNATIRQNILGQSEMEQEWYDAVIRACALDKDFADQSNGDQSIVGTKGISLSGGQKHRVSLARALYSRKHMILVDDVLSGLDWTTQETVWTEVFGPQGLIRRNSLTAVLATHHLHNIQQADRIVLLSDGKIIQQGDFATVSQVEQFKNLLSKQTDNPRSGTRASDDGSGTVTPINKVDTTDAKDKPAAEDEDIATDPLLQKPGDASLYAYYLKHIGLARSLTCLLTGLILPAANIGSNLWLKVWTEANESGRNVNTALYYSIYSLLVTMNLLSMGFDIWYIMAKVTLRATRGVHMDLLKTVMAAPLSFFVNTNAGDIVNRFTKDMSFVEAQMPVGLITTWFGLRAVIANGALVLPGSSYVAAAIPVTLLFIYILQKVYLRTSRQLRHHDLQAAAPLNTHILEIIDGLATIRAFGWRDAYRDTGIALVDDSQRPHYLLYCVQRWLQLILDLYVAALAVLLVTLGVLLPAASSKGGMALALTNMVGLGGSLANLVSSWTSLETSLGALARIKDFETDTPQEAAPDQPETLPSPPWPSKGELEFKDATASYTALPGSAPAVDHVSLKIRNGEKVAICGRTGSGKSSLILALFRLLELDSGSITIDGLDLSNIQQNDARKSLISVPQEPTLFPGTVRSNLWLASSEPPTDDVLRAALQKVELWDVVSSLSEGFNTDMASVSLSQGQKQLLCLCRAVLRRDTSALLVLDEAMSAVDGHTEQLMVRVLEAEFAQHTVISVAHRLNTVRGFDRVVVLEGGKIVEVGNPEELLGLADGKLRALWDSRH